MLQSQLDHLMGRVLDANPDVSDIIATPEKPLMAEVHGQLKEAGAGLGRLTPFQTESLALRLVGRNQRLMADLARRGSCDLSYDLPGRARFRVNIFSRRGSLCIIMRQLPSRVASMEQLGLPKPFHEMVTEKYGLILVTGGTGTGKSTSLAALIDGINDTLPVHIVTLEDPIEFVHRHKRGVVNQREMGVDFDTFSSGLRAALRQAPKVILVGELRDRETMEIALQAAETGHLVLGTLHTSDAGQTISRIIGMFELSEERFIRGRLAESLKYVVSQRLLPKEGGGRAPAFEIMRTSLRVREVIDKGEHGDKTFYNVIQDGGNVGMMTFDQHLLQLFQEGQISADSALLAATDKSRLRQMIDQVKSSRGEKVTDIEGLSLDTEYKPDMSGLDSKDDL